MKKLGVPKGFRDFSPSEMVKRNFIFNTLKSVFVKYGFMPIETPTMERVETLMGKYGEEGDRLIFKVLKRGADLDRTLEKVKSDQPAQLADDALRYDLTVPFARYVVQHQNEINFPFKRYQIQPVWRADRPQAGRYREFYQCDVDVVGTDSLICEVELLQIYTEAYQKLGIKEYSIKLNNRKILSGIAEVIGQSDKIIDITVAIDKLDKIGVEGVNKELEEKGIDAQAIQQLQPIIHLTGTPLEKMAVMKEVLESSEIGLQGIAEFEEIYTTCVDLDCADHIDFDVTLARGLNYYTGTIFEVKAEGFNGSISGGGRYDNLTGIFGLPDVSGVGISFGADRTYDLMENLNLFPDFDKDTTQVLFVNFGKEESQYAFKLLTKLRAKGVNGEMYPDAAKMKKQMKYADGINVPYVAICGSDEVAQNKVLLKRLADGNQELLDVDDFFQIFE